MVLVQDGPATVILGEVDNLAHDLIGMPDVVGGAGHADGQPLPAVQFRHLGNRDVEATDAENSLLASDVPAAPFFSIRARKPF